MTRASLLLAALLLLPGCTDDHPPHYYDECVASHVDMMPTVVPVTSIGPSGTVSVSTQPTMLPFVTCDETERRCDPGGPDYVGDRTCRP